MTSDMQGMARHDGVLAWRGFMSIVIDFGKRNDNLECRAG
jgi:hypothetical protein